MRKSWYFLLLAVFICQVYTAEASLDFSNFVTVGFEGKAELEFNQPEDLVQAPDGNFLIADTGNNRIQVFDAQGKFLRIIPPPKAKNDALAAAPTDNRPANIIKLETTGFRKPTGLAFDSEGNLYVTLMNQDLIAVIDYPSGQIKSTIGSSGKKEGQFWIPMDIDIDDQDRIAVAEFRNRRVQILDLDGNQINEIIYQEQTEKGGYRHLEPRGVFWTQDGDLIVTYPNYHQIVCWNIKEGTIRWRYGGKNSGNKKGMLNNPSFVAQGIDSHLMISDTKNHRIVEITRDGKYYETHSQKGSSKGRLNLPRGLVLTKDETMIVADSGNSRIQFFTAGPTTILLKEAKALANRDEWNSVMMNVEKILQLQPNNEQALDLKVNALYYFGDNAFKNGDYDKAEDYYRMVLRYRPDDGNIPQKLDKIFWEVNRPILIGVVAIVVGLIALVILIWLLKLVFRRIKAKVTE